MDKSCDISLPSRHAPPHFAIVDRGNRPNIIYLTVCTWNREPILASRPMYHLLIEMWQKADTWLVGRFVILPDHIHLFCAPAEVVHPSLTVWVSYWKRMTTIARRQTHPAFRWQVNFWDTQLRSGDSYDAKWAYVYENPVRHGLVQKAEDCPFPGRCMISFGPPIDNDYALTWRDRVLAIRLSRARRVSNQGPFHVQPVAESF